MSLVSDPAAGSAGASGPVSGHRRLPVGALFGDVDSTRLPLPVTAAALVTIAALAATALAGPGLFAALLAVLALIVALGWPLLCGAAGMMQVQAGTAGGGLLVAATVGMTTGPHRLVWLPVAVAIGMIATYFLQLLRADRHRLTEAMGVTMTGLACVSSGAALVPLTLTEPGVRFLFIGLAGMAAGGLAELTGRVRVIGGRSMLVVMLAGALTGWLVAGAVGVAGASGPVGLGLGMLVATFSVSARRVFGTVPGARELPGQVALGVGTVLLPGVLVLALGGIAKVLPG